MDRLRIERIGGLGGFGLPGSRISSEGEQPMASLSQDDRAAVEALFAGGPDPAAPVADGFRYRLTRTRDGRDETVEVPEAAVPSAVRAGVTDRLR